MSLPVFVCKDLKASLVYTNCSTAPICNSFLVATATRVVNHNFRVNPRADWLEAAHTPNTPTLEMFTEVSGTSSWLLRSDICYVTVHTYKHACLIIKKNRRTHQCLSQHISKHQTAANIDWLPLNTHLHTVFLFHYYFINKHACIVEG